MSEMLTELLGGAAATLVAAVVVKTGAVLLAALAVALLLRRRSAALRHRVWTAAFAALALLPLAALVLPSVAVPVLPAGALAPSSAAFEAEAEVALAKEPEVEAGGGLEPVTRLEKAAAAAAAGAGASARGGWPLSRAGTLAAAWLGGVVLLLLPLVAGLSRVAWIGARARPLQEAPRATPLPARVRVKVARGARVPMVWGLRRPVILLPDDATRWRPEELRAVLVHELAHVERRDWAVQVAARVTAAVFWFQPLVWVAHRRLLLEAERACDDHVLAAGLAPWDYAQQLVTLARRSFTTEAAAVAMARPGHLGARVRDLLDRHRRREPCSRAQAVAVTAALALAALLVAPARPVAMEAERPFPSVTGPAFPGSFEKVETGGSGGGARWGGASRIVDHRHELTPLMAAALDGDRARARDLLAERADPDAGVTSLGTPLILAADAGDLEMVRLLLDRGADPARAETGNERPGDLPRTPLGAAARSGHPEVVRLLLDRGAPVDGTPRSDGTPLMIAARHGHLGVARLLLDRGADPNAVVLGDGTPLIEAVRGGEREIVELLLERGAEPDTWVPRDESALFHAVDAGDAELVERLLDAGAELDVEWPGDGIPLSLAVDRGHREVARLLLDRGAREGPDRDRDRDDASPLTEAVRQGAADLVEALLDAGADPDEWSRREEGPLYHAVENGDARMAERLLDRGADPDATWPGDGSPLIVAARAGHLPMVRLLVERGADVEKQVEGDENALIQAAGAGHLDVVRFLVEAGADPDSRVRVRASWRDAGYEDRTPLLMARRGGHRAVERYLMSAGARDGGGPIGAPGAASTWLSIERDGRLLVVPRGVTVEVRGRGNLPFPAGRGTIAVPEDLVVEIGGEAVRDDRSVGDPGERVRLVDRGGRTAWEIHRASSRDLRGEGTRISDRRRVSARIDSSEPTRFYVSVDAAGAVTFFEPET